MLDVVRGRAGATRAEVSAETGFSWASVSKIVDDLLVQGFLRDGVTARVGRSGPDPNVLAIEPSAGYFLGVEVGATFVKAHIIDFAFQIADSRIGTSSFQIDFGEAGIAVTRVLENINGVVAESLAQASSRNYDLLGIGFAWPGAVDRARGVFRFGPNVQFFSQLAITDILSPEQLRLFDDRSVVLDHDSACAAIAEKEVGGVGWTARTERDIAVLYVSTGVGLGLVLDGIVYRGARNAAGELGHIIVKEDGFRCGCGRVGCLETEISEVAILRKWRTRSSKTSTPRNSVQELVSLASEGNQKARELFVEFGEWLGEGLSYVVNLLNPELILISTPSFQGYDLYHPSLRGRLEDKAWRFGLESLRVEGSRLGAEGVSIGAAISAYHALQQTP